MPETDAGMIAARLALRIVTFCERRGHDPGRLTTKAGVSLRALKEPDARVPYPLVEALGLVALKLTDEPDFGLMMASDVEAPSDFDAGMLALMASPTVGAAFERLVVSQRFWGDGERASLRPLEAGVAIRYRLRAQSPLYRRHAHECALAEIALGIRVLSGAPVSASLVRFDHARPASTRAHERIFECALEFDAEAAEIVFDEQALATPMQNANAAFLAIFDQQVRRAVERIELERASDLVRATARVALAGGNCTVGKTARCMGMSTRTLQRRLREEGTTFARIVDALRRELSDAYLDRGLPVGEVAHLLGYSDPTAFTHAYRRWTGQSPSTRQRG